MADALRECNGLQSLAARKLGIDFTTLSRHVKNNPELRRICDIALEARLDRAEGQLDLLVGTPGPGQLGAICFLLKCRGKVRGYIERQEHSGPGGAPLFTPEAMRGMIAFNDTLDRSRTEASKAEASANGCEDHASQSCPPVNGWKVSASPTPGPAQP